MNTRFYGVGPLGVAWRSYRRRNERSFHPAVIGLPFHVDPAEWDRVWQLRVGPIVIAWTL